MQMKRNCDTVQYPTEFTMQSLYDMKQLLISEVCRWNRNRKNMHRDSQMREISQSVTD